MSFLRNAFSVVSTQVAIAPIALVSSVLLARLLSVHDRGVVALATEFASLVVVLASLGGAQACIYRLRRARVAPATVAAAALWACLALSSAAILLCVALRAPLLERFFGSASPLLFGLALAIVPFQLLGLLLTGVARGLDRFDLHNGYQLAMAGGAALALALALGLAESSARAALVALLSVHVVVSLLLVARVLARTGLRPRLPRGELRAMLPFGLKSHGQLVLTNLHQRADVFILAWLLADPAQVGLYAVAVGILNRARLLPSAIALSLFPTLAGLERADAARFAARVLRHALLWTALSVALLLPLAPWLVPLVFGARYAGSVAPFLLLLPGTLAVTVSLVLARYLSARNRHGINIAALAVATAANVALNLWLVPRHGILGAAAASLGSTSLQAALVLLAFLRDSGARLRQVLLIGWDDLLGYPRLAGLWGRRLRGVR